MHAIRYAFSMFLAISINGNTDLKLAHRVHPGLEEFVLSNIKDTVMKACVEPLIARLVLYLEAPPRLEC